VWIVELVGEMETETAGGFTTLTVALADTEFRYTLCAVTVIETEGTFEGAT
jgi:hypothetical protein